MSTDTPTTPRPTITERRAAAEELRALEAKLTSGTLTAKERARRAGLRGLIRRHDAPPEDLPAPAPTVDELRAELAALGQRVEDRLEAERAALREQALAEWAGRRAAMARTLAQRMDALAAGLTGASLTGAFDIAGIADLRAMSDDTTDAEMRRRIGAYRFAVRATRHEAAELDRLRRAVAAHESAGRPTPAQERQQRLAQQQTTTEETR